MHTLSIIIPVYNEAENIVKLLDEILISCQAFNPEIIIVDDGSTDGLQYATLIGKSPQVHVLELSRNYGQSAALAAGIEFATGEIIATMDGDLQNDPRDLVQMVNTLQSTQSDIVIGNRVNRQDSYFRIQISKVANAMIRSATKVRIQDYGCTMKVMRKEIANGLGLYGELHRFIPVLAYLQGARLEQVDVHHRPRISGKSKYGYSRTLRVASDLILVLFFQRFMKRPMHLFGTLGIIILLAGVCINIYMIYLKILGQDIWGKPLMLLGIFCVIAGIQLLTIGIFAELIMRTYYESQNKKTYRIRKIWEAPSP